MRHNTGTHMLAKSSEHYDEGNPEENPGKGRLGFSVNGKVLKMLV